jgi:hypothetical protein
MNSGRLDAVACNPVAERSAATPARQRPPGRAARPVRPANGKGVIPAIAEANAATAFQPAVVVPTRDRQPARSPPSGRKPVGRPVSLTAKPTASGNRTVVRTERIHNSQQSHWLWETSSDPFSRCLFPLRQTARPQPALRPRSRRPAGRAGTHEMPSMTPRGRPRTTVVRPRVFFSPA